MVSGGKSKENAGQVHALQRCVMATKDAFNFFIETEM